MRATKTTTTKAPPTKAAPKEPEHSVKWVVAKLKKNKEIDITEDELRIYRRDHDKAILVSVPNDEDDDSEPDLTKVSNVRAALADIPWEVKENQLTYSYLFVIKAP